MKKQNRYEEITKARKVLELPESATMEEIKICYRRLITKWHPDVCPEKKGLCEKMTIKIMNAYKLIMGYCNHYKFSFSKEEVQKYDSPEEWWFKRFGNDPIWPNSNSV